MNLILFHFNLNVVKCRPFSIVMLSNWLNLPRTRDRLLDLNDRQVFCNFPVAFLNESVSPSLGRGRVVPPPPMLVRQWGWPFGRAPREICPAISTHFHLGGDCTTTMRWQDAGNQSISINLGRLSKEKASRPNHFGVC